MEIDPNTPVVYVLQKESNRDFSDAERYGRLKFLFYKDIFADDVDDQLPQVYKTLDEHMGFFRPYIDFVCLTGDPLYMAVVMHWLGTKRINAARVLKYDRVERGYYQVWLGNREDLPKCRTELKN